LRQCRSRPASLSWARALWLGDGKKRRAPDWPAPNFTIPTSRGDNIDNILHGVSTSQDYPGSSCEQRCEQRCCGQLSSWRLCSSCVDILAAGHRSAHHPTEEKSTFLDAVNLCPLEHLGDVLSPRKCWPRCGTQHQGVVKRLSNDCTGSCQEPSLRGKTHPA